MSYERRDLSRISLTVTEPSVNGIKAYESRRGLICPDRRCFVQSMMQDSGRRIGGNGVPSSASGGSMYSYTFPVQREQPNPYLSNKSTNFYSTQRDLQQQQQAIAYGRQGGNSMMMIGGGGGGQSAAPMITQYSQPQQRMGTPTRRGDYAYEPGAYSQSRGGPMLIPRSGTPTGGAAGGYVDLERQSNISRRY